MMKSMGHTVFLYGAENSDASWCDELIPIISEEERTTLLESFSGRANTATEYQHAWIDERSPLWQLSNPRMIREIGLRKQPRDFICQIGGASQETVSLAHPELMTVEYSIGYEGSFGAYRVFESNIWRHWTYGYQKISEGRFFDTVIPVFFDPAEFEFREKKEPFALYLGRLTPKKGVEVAIQSAKLAGLPLKIIGHDREKDLVPRGVEFLGALPQAERNNYLSRASVVLCPTLYVEPFCCVSVEAQMCGTPVVSTDWGGFTENVEHGKTGFHCNYLGGFVDGIKKSLELDKAYIRARAERLYSMHNINHDYQRYFERLSTLWGDGWNTI